MPKSWWPGDERVEPYMLNLYNTLNKYNLDTSTKTDIYNKAYEAVYAAIKDYATDKKEAEQDIEYEVLFDKKSGIKPMKGEGE